MSDFRRHLDNIFGRARKTDSPAPPEPGPQASVPQSLPQDAAEWQNEAQRFADLGQWKHAIACLDQALALDPQCAAAWYDKARYLGASGRLEEAIDSFNQTLALDPKMAPAWFSKALVDEGMGLMRDATYSYERFIAVASVQDKEQIAYVRRRLGELRVGGNDSVDPPASPERMSSAPAPRHSSQTSSTTGEAQPERHHITRFRVSRVHGPARAPEDLTALHSKGLNLAALGRLDDAVDCYSEALTLDPRMAATWFSKALAEEKIGRMRDAANSYQRFIDVAAGQDLKQIAYVRERLHELGFDGEDKANLPASPDAAQTIPVPLLQDAAVWVAEGRKLADLDRQEEALACYNRALAFNRQDPMIWQWKGVCLIALDRHEEAVNCISQALNLNPQDVGAWHIKGLLLSVLGQTSEVLACFDHVVALNPQDTAAWHNRGNCLVALFRLEDAIACFDMVLALEPQSAFAWHSKGRCLAELGALEQAIVCYERAVAFEPRMAAAWSDKALAEDQAGRVRDAENSYRRYLIVAPTDDEEQIQHARRRLRELGSGAEGAPDPPALDEPVLRGRTPPHPAQIFSPAAKEPPEVVRMAGGAIAYFDRPLAVSSLHDPTSLKNEGVINAMLGRHEDAIRDFDRMMAANPRDAYLRNVCLWCNKALSLTTLGRHEETIACCDVALAINSSFSAALLDKGVSLAILGRREEALACFDEVLVHVAENDQAWNNKGIILAAVGRRKEALACFDRALTINSKNDKAWFNRAVADDNEGYGLDAARSYKRFIALASADTLAFNKEDPWIEYAQRRVGELKAGSGSSAETPFTPGARQVHQAPQTIPPLASPEQSTGEPGAALEQPQHARAMAPLVTGVKDNDLELRSATFGALGPLGDARAVAPLQPITDGDADVRKAANETLAKLSEPKGDAPARPEIGPVAAPAELPGAKRVTGRMYQKGDRIVEGIQVLETLGWGGFGVVYLVKVSNISGGDLPNTLFMHSNEFALKTFRDEYLAAPLVRQRFHHEAQVLVDLGRHPYLVHCLGVYEIDGRLYIGTEHIAPNVKGLNSLEDYLLQDPPDLAQSLRWGIQCCYGMEYAYSKGLSCHRDLKPANILIEQDRTVKIADFGLAGVLDHSRLVDGIHVHFADGIVGLSGQTLEGAAFGTPTHMPPEQFTDAASCDERSDVYAFGVVLYQMTTRGHLPFLAALPRDSSPAERLRFWHEMRKLQTMVDVPQINSPVFPIIRHCLAKQPDERYQTFRELRRDLESLLLRQTGEVVEPPRVQGLLASDWCRKGDSLVALGRWEEAIACYDQALAVRPRYAVAWNNKGRCLADLGRSEEAMICCDRALFLDPRSIHAWKHKANLLAKAGRFEEAIACYDHVLALDPRSIHAWKNKANLLAGAGRLEEAIVCYDHALALEARDAM